MLTMSSSDNNMKQTKRHTKTAMRARRHRRSHSDEDLADCVKYIETPRFNRLSEARADATRKKLLLGIDGHGT